MEKIKIDLCFGTTCFVMGSTQLQELFDIIPEKYGDTIEVSRHSCLSLCSANLDYTRSPYVKINGQIIYEATPEKIIDAIEERLNNEKH